MFGGIEMEQRKTPFTSFIKPLIKQTTRLSRKNMKKEMSSLKPTIMPLIDVVEQIHHSYYLRHQSFSTSRNTISWEFNYIH